VGIASILLVAACPEGRGGQYTCTPPGADLGGRLMPRGGGAGPHWGVRGGRFGGYEGGGTATLVEVSAMLMPLLSANCLPISLRVLRSRRGRAAFTVFLWLCSAARAASSSSRLSAARAAYRHNIILLFMLLAKSLSRVVLVH
jgi:hypothetical protein